MKDGIMLFAGIVVIGIMVSVACIVIKKVIEFMTMAIIVAIVVLAIISGGKYIVKQIPSGIETIAKGAKDTVSNISFENIKVSVTDFME